MFTPKSGTLKFETWVICMPARAPPRRCCDWGARARTRSGAGRTRRREGVRSATALGIALRAAGLAQGGSKGLELLDSSAATLWSSPALLERRIRWQS